MSVVRGITVGLCALILASTMGCASVSGKVKKAATNAGQETIDALRKPMQKLSYSMLKREVLKHNPAAKDYPKEYFEQFEGKDIGYAFAETKLTERSYDLDGDGKDDKIAFSSKSTVKEWKGKKSKDVYEKDNTIQVDFSTGREQFIYTATGGRLLDVTQYTHTIITARDKSTGIVESTQTLMTDNLSIILEDYGLGGKSPMGYIIPSRR